MKQLFSILVILLFTTISFVQLPQPVRDNSAVFSNPDTSYIWTLYNSLEYSYANTDSIRFFYKNLKSGVTYVATSIDGRTFINKRKVLTSHGFNQGVYRLGTSENLRGVKNTL